MSYLKADMNLAYESQLRTSELMYFEKLKRFCLSIFTSSSSLFLSGLKCYHEEKCNTLLRSLADNANLANERFLRIQCH
jgi:hypothetical protein